MSNDVVIHGDDFSNSLLQIENTQKMCEALMRTAHYAKMGKDGIFAIVTTARSLGIDPIRALNGGLYYVQGRVGMSTELMASLIREKGHSIIKDKISTDEKCVLHGKRSDNGDTWTISFSLNDAKRAGIYNDKTPWGKYPSTMCYNRAMSVLARQLFPDVIKGAGFTADELQEAKPAFNRESKQDDIVIEEVKITDQQSEELRILLSRTSENYQDKVWKALTKQNIVSLNELNEDTYNRIKVAAEKNIVEIPVIEEFGEE